MKYRSRHHEFDGGIIVVLAGFAILIVILIVVTIFSLKEQDYKHEIELKKIELCGEEEE
jgi:hypothetical protein